MIVSTGLTEQQKESLLKFFLLHCELRNLDNPQGIFTHEVRFFNDPDKVTYDTANLISDAMMNLKKSVWGIL